LTTKIFEITSSTPTILPQADGQREQQLLQSILTATPRPKQKNLTSVVINHTVSRSTKVALIVLPEWAPFIAPYNLARLTALSRCSGFETRSYDLNIACYQYSDKSHWSPLNDWKWFGDKYWTDIHPGFKTLLHQYLDELTIFAPDIVGFTVYFTNNQCTTWFMQELKKRLPSVKIIAGGPNAIQEKIEDTSLVDHVVIGEGEQIFLEILEKTEAGISIPEKFIRHEKSNRIDLDSMPIPDYSDVNFENYQINGISAEVSRGCIANCTFCSETTFWKYRGRQSGNIIDEIEYQYNTYGIEFVWFIDSLINGNLKELRAFAQGLIEKDIKIKYVGYARADPRMDLAYLQDLANSGCQSFSVGIESGSQKILNLMKKNVNRSAIEQNLKDITTVGIVVHSSWFVGYPGEVMTDVAQTLTLVWRLRHTNLLSVGFGVCNMPRDTPLYMERTKLGVADQEHWAGDWITADYSNTILHRYIRYKSIYILLNQFRNRERDTMLSEGYFKLDRPGIDNHYTLTYNPANIVNDIPYEEDFDYDIIKIDTWNPIEKTVVNEIWPLFRVLWLAFGPFTIDLNFDHNIDAAEFGTNRHLNDGISTYFSHHVFEINADGNWTANFKSELITSGPNGNPDMQGRDFSFKLDWQGSGQWTRRS
jgi:hypothetical protein